MCDVHRQVVVKGAEAGLVAGLALVAYVDLRGGLVADLEHGEPGRPLAGCQTAVNPPFDLSAQFLCDFLSVEDVCAHDWPATAHLLAPGASSHGPRRRAKRNPRIFC